MRCTFGIVCLLLAVTAGAGTGVPLVRCPAAPPRVQEYELQEMWRLDPLAAETPLLKAVGDEDGISGMGMKLDIGSGKKKKGKGKGKKNKKKNKKNADKVGGGADGGGGNNAARPLATTKELAARVVSMSVKELKKTIADARLSHAINAREDGIARGRLNVHATRPKKLLLDIENRVGADETHAGSRVHDEAAALHANNRVMFCNGLDFHLQRAVGLERLMMVAVHGQPGAQQHGVALG